MCTPGKEPCFRNNRDINLQPPKELESPKATEFAWTLQERPRVITTAGSESCHCTAASPSAKLWAQEGIFLVYIYEQSWSPSRPEPQQLSHPAVTSGFRFPYQNTWSGQTAHGLTLPKAPPQTLTINNNMEGHNYVL